jgi:hypothetical protein
MKVAAQPLLNLGAWRRLDGSPGGAKLSLPPAHLATHAVVVGMTGSGKTGLVTVLVEEALSAGIPALIVDVKGDLPNLLLSFPSCASEHFVPWLDPSVSPVPDQAAALAEQRQQAFADWAISPARLRTFCDGIAVRVITPGSTAGELLHVLSPLERRSPRWDTDPESARAALSAAVSLVLRLLGRDPDPAKSKEHVLLSLLAERRLAAGEQTDLATLMQDVTTPPIAEVGALRVDSFIKRTERANLAAGLNALLASPSFSSWRQGSSLDIAEWLTPKQGRTPAVVVSVAHLDDEERALVLGVLLEEILSWVRSLPGTQRLKALIVFDEVYGFLPPHPANPPTKRPLVALMKQARAFGVGVVVATQNPMDLDYRALSNAGFWCVGRLQTDADRARVIDGIAGSQDVNEEDVPNLGRVVQRLADRWFVVRNTHARSGPILLKPRQTLSWLRGPMTRHELRLARTHSPVHLPHPEPTEHSTPVSGIEPALAAALPLPPANTKGSNDACPTPVSKSSPAPEKAETNTPST